MSAAAQPDEVDEPFPIFCLANRYLLYDVNTVFHARKAHNVCGVLIGGLPQASQQNVFLGLPAELMPEEARLLVEKRVAYIVDDAKAHKRGFLGNNLSAEERNAYHRALRNQGVGAAKDASKRAEDRRKAALKEKTGSDNWNDIPEDMMVASSSGRKKKGKRDRGAARSGTATPDESETSLFASPMDSAPLQSQSSGPNTPDPEPYGITPTTSYPPLQGPVPQSNIESELAPEVPSSYPLFRHLHEKGYFLSPGLRFGCQYMAYPGDPLRFHSHFLCNGMDWDEEFDLLDLVGGGRLGTGVKKGFLIGGREEGEQSSRLEASEIRATAGEAQDVTSSGVRTFCIEWGGM